MRDRAQHHDVYEVELSMLCRIAAAWDQARLEQLTYLEEALDQRNLTCRIAALQHLAWLSSVN